MNRAIALGSFAYVAVGMVLAMAAYPTVRRETGPLGLTRRPVWATIVWIVVAWPYHLFSGRNER